MLDQVITFINQNADSAPFIIFGMLLLAGFNLPVSEDIMIFISAMLAAENPEKLPHLFAGVFLGAYCSDLICFGLGRFLGERLWNIKWFAKMVSREKVERLSNFYKKYGVLTLIFGRFIPFGVRNALFLTAGIGKMNFLKFALSDLLAATISCSFFFYLYYTYGESVIEIIKKGNIVIFVIALLIASAIFFKKRSQKVRRTF